MVRSRRIAIIGHFGGKEELLDGQTVKTKTLYQELSEKTNWRIRKVDTYYRQKNPVKLLCQSVFTLLTTRDVVVILSENGRRFYFPILYFFAQVFRTRVYHDLIGARLAKNVTEYPAFRKYLNSFQVSWVETASVKAELETVGVTNVQLLPNFKRLKIASADQRERSAAEPHKLCTFSRVMREKGIEDVMNAVKAVNERSGRTVYSLDIYGPADPQQIDWFETLQKTFPDYVRYRGSVHYEKSVDTLKHYFALAFPTRFYTEGVPGTIIDAYAAGVPVIASRWESFSDVVEHGVTGYGYPFEDVDALTDMLIQFAEMPEKITGLVENCLKKAEYYLPEKSVAIIMDSIMSASGKT